MKLAEEDDLEVQKRRKKISLLLAISVCIERSVDRMSRYRYFT